MKSRTWNAKLPDCFYVLGDFDFDKPITESAFRAYLRDWLGVKRLPRGTAVWTK